MARIRYYVEQSPGRFYDAPEPAKRSARSLSKAVPSGVYVIAEQYDADLRDYSPVGSIAYYGGLQDAREGIFA
jgi:hypothetical protein